ncbi:MAG: hypothetical protein ABIH21_03320 [Patescibacteria group bacterium]
MIPFLIGLAGLSGAGKSTLTDHLEMQGGVKRFRLDAFYKDESECPVVKGIVHWDLPDSLHMDDVYQTLLSIKRGEDVFIPVYNRGQNKRIGNILYKPAPVVFAEGLMLFSDQRVRELFDLRIWLDVSEELALQRRLERQPYYDLNYYHNVAKLAAREHVLPNKQFAHECINGHESMVEVTAKADFLINKYLFSET